MESILKRNKNGMVLLKKIDVGTCGVFEYSFNLIRIGFLKSITHLAIVPVLHRNMNKLMGMAEPEDYMTYKIDRDKMYALTQNGILFTWNIITGKILSQITLENHDYSNYDLASTYKNGRVLLKSKEDI